MRDLLAKTRGRALPLPRFRTLSDLDQPVSLPPIEPRRRVRAVAVPDCPVGPAHIPVPPPPRPAQRARPLVFPAPPLRGLAVPGVHISAIGSHSELVAEGDVMQHCAGSQKSYARRVASGQLFFYRMLRPERLTIAIRPGFLGWTVEEMKGFRNRSPLDSSRTLVLNWLRRCNESPGETTRDDPPVFGRPNPPAFRPIGRPRHRTPANQLSFDFSVVSGPA